MNKTHKGTRKGFTLLEILLVIAAIGILAAIVLVAINPNRQIAQARNAQRRSDVNTIYKALEQYLIDNQSYPAGVDETPKDICGTTTGCVNLGVLVPNYLAAIPTDPQGGAYRVSKNSDNNRISVTAPSAELSQKIVINPLPPTPEELIQEQITAGTLIPTGTQQLVLNRLVYKNNAGTQTYIDKATTTKTCPANYIKVPGNSMYGTSDFCVMKYEAKTISPAATTAAAGTPEAWISQTNAITACTNNNTGGVTGYGLITNTEWMTIARNVEGQGVNWTGGAVGSGGLWRGHSDNSPGNALAANTNDTLGYEGTGNANETPASIERRTYTLSNGETIWDLSGNFQEWTNDTIMGANKPTGGSEFTAMTGYGQLIYDLTRPSNTGNSSQNMGQYIAGSLTGGPFAFVRGGMFSYTTLAGVFTLSLSDTPADTGSRLGFRCVLR